MTWAGDVEQESAELAERGLQRELGELQRWASAALGVDVSLALHPSGDVELRSYGDWTTTLRVVGLIPQPSVVLSLAFVLEGADIWLVAAGEADQALAALRRLVVNQAAATVKL